MKQIHGWVPDFELGERVAWKMIDGRTMAGDVVEHGYQRYSVRRVDGTVCTIDAVRGPKLRPATFDDVMAACDVFTKGK